MDLTAFCGGVAGAMFFYLVWDIAPRVRDWHKNRLIRRLDARFPRWRDDVNTRTFEKWLDANPGMRDKVNSLRYDDAAECLRAYYAKPATNYATSPPHTFTRGDGWNK